MESDRLRIQKVFSTYWQQFSRVIDKTLPSLEKTEIENENEAFSAQNVCTIIHFPIKEQLNSSEKNLH